MLQIPLWKRIAILAVVALAFVYAMPNLFYSRVEAHNDALVAAERAGFETPEQAAARGNALYGPGTPIYVGNNPGQEVMCTTTAAGYNDRGEKVALTAGHCGNVGDAVRSADSWQLGRTGTSEYLLRGAWVYRKVGAQVYRYDTLPDFVRELQSGALGGSWRETPEGTREIDRFID